MRDPSKFRERFKAYKDGKSVREIYGLPGYANGTVGEDPELDMIKKYEGWKDKTYLDSKGIPTIGWGFTDSSLVSKGTMSRKEGDAYLSKRVQKRKAYLRNKLGPNIWDRLDTTTKAALLSYDHNYPAGFGDNTRFMNHWRAGRYNDAVGEMDAGINDPSSPGLKSRRLDEQAAVRKDSFLFPRVKSQKPADALILKSDATRVVPIPTIQQQAIDYSDRRNAVAAEALRAMWAHNVMEDMKGAYQVPIWESPSLPALTPVEYDVTPMRYKNGKLPGYKGGMIPWEDDDVQEKAQLWADDWKFRLLPAARSKVILQWNATGNRSEPESAELYTLRRIKQTEWKKPSGRKMLEIIPSAVDLVPVAGDIKQGLEAASATTKGNYLEAGLLGAGLLIPNAVEKSIKPVLKNIDYRLRDNSGKVIDFYNLLRKKAAMAELTGDYSLGAFTKDIAKDKYYTMGIQKGKEYFDYPSIVLQILETSIKPRMSTMRPWMPEKEFDKEFYRNANGMWSMHPIDTWKAAYGDETTVTGLYTPGTGKISVRAGGGGDEVTNILLHEVRHKLDNGIPLTEEEESILRSAYGDRFLEVPKVSEDWDITGIGRDYDMWPEAVTTNRDARSLALGPMERRMNVHLQNIVIDKLSDLLILEAVANANGYGRRFVDNIIGDGPLDASLVPKEQIKAWREAMKKVGMFSGAAYLASNLVPEYAYGKLPGYNNGKIRIKPANRGKFNATKKRTGKTTEELTHSKNPLTRKRAIFAQNARK